jgi:hypothetical protein
VLINDEGNLGHLKPPHFAGDPCVPRFKFALRGVFARQIERKLLKRDETLRGLSYKCTLGHPYYRFVFKMQFSSLKRGFFGTQSRRCHTGTESTRMSGEPGTVTSGQVRFITRPKSRTMRATRQLMLPPSTVS